MYLVGAWLVVQVAATLLPVFGAPEWVTKVLVGLLAFGFLAALVFSWIYELTPEVLKRDGEVCAAPSIAPQTARRMDRMLLVAMALALSYFALDMFVLAPGREAQRVASATSDAKVGADAAAATNAPRIDPRSIAVLPFENLSQEADNAFFVSGMQDLILTNLSKIRDLEVVSRSSMEKYASHPENLKVVGA